MTTRILPVEEWPRLQGTEADTLWPTLDPLHAQILVVEEGDQILGCWTLLMIPHVECLWVHPTARGRVSIARRLWIGMRRLTAQMGAHFVWTAAVADPVRVMLASAGAHKVEGDHYVLPMGKVQ